MLIVVQTAGLEEVSGSGGGLPGRLVGRAAARYNLKLQALQPGLEINQLHEGSMVCELCLRPKLPHLP